jgi:hypothetical protein
MAAHHRYHVIEAETLAARKRHRVLIEKALREGGLSPQMRDELMRELKQAVFKEEAAQKLFDEGEEEERKEETEGSGGKQQGGSGGSGGGGGMGRGDESADKASDEGNLDDIAVFELLLFLAEHDTSQSYVPESIVNANADQALGAATLLYDPQGQIALIGETYAPEPDGTPHAPSIFLPSLEHHAASLGAHTMHVNVHPNAVALFRTFGYEIQKRSAGRKGASMMQTMRKTLTFQIKPPGTDYV